MDRVSKGKGTQRKGKVENVKNGGGNLVKTVGGCL